MLKVTDGHFSIYSNIQNYNLFNLNGVKCFKLAENVIIVIKSSLGGIIVINVVLTTYLWRKVKKKNINHVFALSPSK